MLSNTFNIMGLDPGSNLGVSILSIDANKLSIEAIDTTRFVLASYSVDNDNMLDRWIALESIIKDIVLEYNPIIVGMEAAFMNQHYPKAVMVLTSYTTIIDKTLYSLGCNKVFRYPPKYIKKIVASGTADKLDMLHSVTSIKEISSKINLYDKTEHEVDATAIAYTVLLEVRDYPYVLYS